MDLSLKDRIYGLLWSGYIHLHWPKLADHCWTGIALVVLALIW